MTAPPETRETGSDDAVAVRRQSVAEAGVGSGADVGSGHGGAQGMDVGAAVVMLGVVVVRVGMRVVVV